jgi:hypothetical protein
MKSAAANAKLKFIRRLAIRHKEEFQIGCGSFWNGRNALPVDIQARPVY